MLICDATLEQKSENLKKFLGEIGTRLKVLERGTPWAYKAELFIGLMKEAVRNVPRISNCPLGFWDCVERLSPHQQPCSAERVSAAW